MLIDYIYNNTQKYFHFSIALMVFFLPISMALPNIFLIISGFFYLFIFFKKRKFNIPLFWYYYLFLILSFIINSIFTGHLLSEISFVSNMIAGFFLFIILKENRNQKLLIQFFLLGILCSVLYSIFKIFNLFMSDSSFNLGSGEDIYKVLLLDRPYLAFCIVLANFFVLKQIRNFSFNNIYYLAVFFITAFCFIISARLAIILNVVLFIHHFIIISKQIKISHKIFFVLTFVLIGFIIVKNPYLKQRMRATSSLEKTILELKAYEPRFIIWDCSYELIKSKGLFGIHSHKELQKYLNKCYIQKIDKEGKLNYYLSSNFNTHNQFFDVILVGGVFSLFLFLALLIIPIFNFKDNLELLSILFLFTAFFMIENVFFRQVGCHLFGIFTALSFKNNE